MIGSTWVEEQLPSGWARSRWHLFIREHEGPTRQAKFQELLARRRELPVSPEFEAMLREYGALMDEHIAGRDKSNVARGKPELLGELIELLHQIEDDDSHGNVVRMPPRD